jgi:hypothetical protein
MGTRIVPINGTDFITVVLSSPAPAGGAEFTITDSNPGVVSYTSPAVLLSGEQSKEVTLTGLSLGTTTISAQLTEYDGSPTTGTVFNIDVEVIDTIVQFTPSPAYSSSGGRVVLKSVKVLSYSLDRIYVTWEIEDTTEEIHDYYFSILRSESPAGPWETLVDEIEDRYSFTDGEVDLRDKWRKFYYKVKLDKKDASETQESDPTTLSAPIDLVAAEVQHRERMYFTEFVGRRALLYPRRAFGQRCHCYDEVLGKSERSRCLECYATGYARGYLNPVVIPIQIDPSAKSIQMQPDILTQQNHTAARTVAYPEIRPRDIIIEAENRRWRVGKVSKTERLRAVVHQELQLVEITRGDIEYQLPVGLSVLENAASENNFKRLFSL